MYSRVNLFTYDLFTFDRKAVTDASWLNTNLLKTRKHFSRMHTTHFSYLGGRFAQPPWRQIPPDAGPLQRQTHSIHTPTRGRSPLPVNRQTPVKTLPCPKLHLWAVLNLHAQKFVHSQKSLRGQLSTIFTLLPVSMIPLPKYFFLLVSYKKEVNMKDMNIK